MATALKNLSEYEKQSVPDASDMRFVIITSEWNSEITDILLAGSEATLLKHGVSAENIIKYIVPGSFELTAAAAMAAETQKTDAFICIGCVIQGETKHFDFICASVAQGLTNLGIRYCKPFIFGVLTTNTFEQARERAGGKHGNKGDEAAVTAIKMVALQKQMKQGRKITGFGTGT